MTFYFVLGMGFCLHICLHHLRAVPKKIRGRHQILSNWSYRRLWAATWILGIEPGPLEEQPVHLSTEPSLQLLNTVPFLWTFISLTWPLCLCSLFLSRIRTHVIVLCPTFGCWDTILLSTKFTLETCSQATNCKQINNNK